MTKGDKGRSAKKRPLGPRPVRILLVLAGGLLLAFALGSDLLTGKPFSFGKLNAVQAAVGALFLLMGIAWPKSRISGVLAKVSLLVLVLFLFVFLAEASCRILGVDFARGEQAFKAHPIYYRSASMPIGESSYRRPGPQTWTGKVFTTEMRLRGIDEVVFPDERELTITYDVDGFRNPEGLTYWEVVVVGDSFVESGYMPYEELFTTLLGAKLERPVRNLGVCNTGPLSHVTYLREFGKSEGTRHAVLAFFEGNDIDDLRREYENRERVRREGKHEPLDIGAKQTSFIQAIKTWMKAKKRKKPLANAKLESGDPILLRYAPPSSEELEKAEVAQLGETLSDWADTARELGITPWLLYLPCKNRVVHARVRCDEKTPAFLANWRPNDLPGYVEGLCKDRGIGYIDATPALRASFMEGRLPFNPVWDSHLNLVGSDLVATVLADALR